MEKYCRKIKRLELSAMDEDVSDAISNCIASYVSQTERVQLNPTGEPNYCVLGGLTLLYALDYS